VPDEDEAEFWSLYRCKRAYLDYLGQKHEEIQEQQSARCYRHAAQWTVAQVEVFNRRKQPVVTYNRIGRKIDGIVGLMEKLKQDPKAYARNPQSTSEMGAELATAVVRYVVESDLRSDIFPFSIEKGAVDGIGGVEMLLERGDKGDIDVGFAEVEPDSYFYDPRSYKADFNDARFQGVGKWLDQDDVVALFPEMEEEIEAMLQSGWDLTSNPDREKQWFQISPDFKRMRVVEIWYKSKGDWKWCIFTGSGKLKEGNGYFYDAKGKQICKYIMFSAFVDQDGDRYGFIRNLRSSQDEINQRRSKGLHELNSRRIKAEDGAFTDIEVTRREAVKPDGVVIYNKGFEMEFDDQTRIANIEGQLKFLEDAKNEIENFGPNPALIGQGLEYKSGRAINLLQQAGVAELGPFVVGVRKWKLQLYRAIWCAVQRYWTAERWIRVTGIDEAPQLVQINGVGIDPQTGLPRVVNTISNLDVSFILDEGPDEVNMMGDAYDTLVALATQGAKIPPAILLELSPLQGTVKKKLLGMLQQPDPMAQQAQQASLAVEMAKAKESEAGATLSMAKAQEIAQGGAHDIVQKQFDFGARQQEHQMKMAESTVKAGAEEQKARLGVATEFMKLQSGAMKSAQQLRHGELQHQQKMRQQAANGGGPK